MKWMEFIKVQTAQSNIAAKLLKIISECKDYHGLLEARVFNHANVDDCSLCLHWNTDKPDLRGSSIGMHLNNTLKKYGLVDHSVWIEKIDREEKTS